MTTIDLASAPKDVSPLSKLTDQAMELSNSDPHTENPQPSMVEQLEDDLVEIESPNKPAIAVLTPAAKKCYDSRKFTCPQPGCSTNVLITH